MDMQMNNHTNSTASDVFCKQPGWGMRNNFQVAIGSDVHCVWYVVLGNIYSLEMYIVACVVSFLLGFTIDGMGYFRKWYARKFLLPKKLSKQSGNKKASNNVDDEDDDDEPPAILFYLQSVFYAASMFIAYWAMLVAMAFETVFFALILCGFLCGHALFSVYLPRNELREKKREARRMAILGAADISSPLRSAGADPGFSAATAAVDCECAEDADCNNNARNDKQLNKSQNGHQHVPTRYEDDDDDEDAAGAEVHAHSPCCAGWNCRS